MDWIVSSFSFRSPLTHPPQHPQKRFICKVSKTHQSATKEVLLDEVTSRVSPVAKFYYDLRREITEIDGKFGSVQVVSIGE